MQVRYKNSPEEVCSSSEFNTHGLGEVIVGGEWGQDSTFVKDLDVKLPNGEWKDMQQAFRDKDIIPDNYNYRFAVPFNEQCKERGYND